MPAKKKIPSARYSAVSYEDEPTKNAGGLTGELLFQLQGSILWYLLAVTIYALGIIGFAVYLSTCRSESSIVKVLPSQSLKVNQFYSSLALSISLTPVAIMIRKIASDLALLHPFAVASKRPVKLSDLDVLMDPGLSSALRLFRYSIFKGLVQTFLLTVGATIVPIGTLLLFTGSYAAPLINIASVGMPTELRNMMTLSIELNVTTDFFTGLGINMFAGNIIRQTGVIAPTPKQLGPTATTNLTYEEDVRYDGIVTYKWSSGCEYTDTISFTEQTGNYEWLYDVTFPNGQKNQGVDAWESRLLVANTSTGKSDFTTYYAVMGTVQETVNMGDAQAQSAIQVSNGAWISRVACTPTFDWELSNCLWKNSTMTDCYASPGSNTTVLDNFALNSLHSFMSIIPLKIYAQNTYTYGLTTLQTALMFDPKATTDHQYRAPVLSDFDNMYGLVAQSLATVTTSGYYGTAEVPTTGSAPQQTYLVRMDVLAALGAMLVLSPFLTTFTLIWNVRNHVPMRKASFLTVANAVRGGRWDSTFFGCCVMPHKELKEKFKNLRVMFGVDAEMTYHVGFAEKVLHIQKGALYMGASGEPN